MTLGNPGITLSNPNELHCEPMEMRNRPNKISEANSLDL